MRKMKNKKTGKIITVIEFIVLKYNGYEYYVTNKKYDDGTVEILAHGDAIEHATIYLSDIKETVYRTKNLKSLFPVPGWKWV
jgi:hypothetical protein